MESKKLISIVVPVYNEVKMIPDIYSRVVAVMEKTGKYDFEIVFFDDGSTDGSKEAVVSLSEKDNRVKAVFFSNNFGYIKNTFYSLQQAKGDAAVLLHADLQNPPEIIPDFIEEWEKGSKVVIGVKNKSRENKIMYFLRTVFYRVMNLIFGMELVPHATDFGLFDRSFCDILREIRSTSPFLRSIINTYSGKGTAYVNYTQDRRYCGKTRFNLGKYYDFAICGIVYRSRNLPRKFLVFGIICLLLSAGEFFINFLPDLVKGIAVNPSQGVLLRCIIGLIELLIIFISVISEYVIYTAQSADSKPMITEEKRINY